MKCFSDNQMKLNTDKCHLLSNRGALDNCQKALRKVNALVILVPYMGTTKRQSFMNVFY